MPFPWHEPFGFDCFPLWAWRDWRASFWYAAPYSDHPFFEGSHRAGAD